MPAALVIRDVSKRYEERRVLQGVNLEVPAARVAAIVGRSGSGKSTLLHLAAGIDRPDAGSVTVAGRDLGAADDADRTRLRRDGIGLVFQFFHLLPMLSVADNVALPELIAGTPARAYRPRVQALLQRVGLADRAAAPAQKLSGGEMQRIAICRALVRRPALLLADEPTGNLDETNGQSVMALMIELVREHGSSLVYVTHSQDIAALADDVYRLHHGVLEPA